MARYIMNVEAAESASREEIEQATRGWLYQSAGITPPISVEGVAFDVDLGGGLAEWVVTFTCRGLSDMACDMCGAREDD